MTYPTPHLLIDGAFVNAGDRVTEPVINPATGKALADLPHANASDLDAALDAAARGFDIWRNMTALERAKIIKRAADLIRERGELIATAMTLEQGKPLTEARGEVAYAADVIEWYAEEGRRAYGRIVPSRVPGVRLMVEQEPVGVAVAFTPWNFPALTPARKIGGALAAGCSLVLKPAEETPATAFELARAFVDAGLPRGVLNEDDSVGAVVLTGAGKAFSAGGDFQHFIKCAREPEVSRATLDNARAFITAMLDLRVPVVAAVNGAAVGFGATLAALCDIVLIADGAFFAEPHINIGLVVGDGISVTWPLYMSMLKAKEYILTGDRIHAPEAVACGLANRVVTSAELMPEALKLAHRLAGQPREALRGSKQLLNLYSKAMVTSVLEPLLAQQFERTQSAEHAAIVQSMIAAQKRNQQ